MEERILTNELIKWLLLKIEREDVVFDTHGERLLGMEGQLAFVFDNYPIDINLCSFKRIQFVKEWEYCPFFTNHNTDWRMAVSIKDLAKRLNIKIVEPGENYD